MWGVSRTGKRFRRQPVTNKRGINVSTLAWFGIALFVMFIIYFMFFFGRKRSSGYRKPIERVQPPPYRAYTKPLKLGSTMKEVPMDRRQKAAVEDDHVDDYLMASALSSTLNSEPRPHDSDRVTPEGDPDE